MNRDVKPGESGWTQITVACKSGPRTVYAKTYGPFAVHRDHDIHAWAVTHTRTGCGLGRVWEDRADAAAFARQMHALVRDEGLDVDSPEPEDVTAALNPHIEAIWTLYEETSAYRPDGEHLPKWTPETYEPYREKVESDG